METQTVTEMLGSAGFIWLDLDSHNLERVRLLAEESMQTFSSCMARGPAVESKGDASGQYGYTADGNEGAAGLQEIRSHVVLPASPPAGHPLLRLAPNFYGGERYEPTWAPLRAHANQLHPILDLLTLMLFESVESRFTLPFGAISARLAMGERLLRFHWYPAIPEGELRPFSVSVRDHSACIWGKELNRGSDRVKIVRASPHIDIGHWTWQVRSSDSFLRFLDRGGNLTRAERMNDGMYGNVGEFLEIDEPRLFAPVHWVDLNEESCLRTRSSLAYFAHIRPTVPCGGQAAGWRLYSRLRDLGYAAEEKLAEVARLLMSESEAHLTSEILDWEADHPEGCPRFAGGLSRYFAFTNRKSGSIVARSEPASPFVDLLGTQGIDLQSLFADPKGSNSG